MHKTILILLIACVGCGRKPQTINQSNNAPQAPQKNKNHNTALFAGEAIQIKQSPFVMYLLGFNPDGDSSGLISKRSESPYSWNIIFLNTETQKYHLLDTTRKMLMRCLYADLSDGAYEVGDTCKFLYYSVIILDNNKDGKLNDEDPHYLFISDKAGDNFKQISPDKFDVKDWKIIKETSKVLISAVDAKEADKKNGDRPEIVHFVYDLNTGSLLRIFDNRFIENIKKLFDKYWHDTE